MKFEDNNIPYLKENIRIEPFDETSNIKRYLLIHNGKRFSISEEVVVVVQLMDGKNTIYDIYLEMIKRLEKPLTLEKVHYIISEFLWQKGLMEGSEYGKEKKNLLDHLFLKIILIRGEYIKYVRFLGFLFHRVLVLPIVCACLLMMYLVLEKRTTQVVSFEGDVSYLWVPIFLFLSVLFHELGHAVATLRYGKRPGDIGMAFYFGFPVLFADVSTSWELDRKKRCVIDIGGIYFQLIFLSVLGGVSLLNEFTFGYQVVWIGAIYLLYNFNPFIKMDGYWLFSDLLGIVNLHSVSSSIVKNNLARIIFNVQRGESVTYGEKTNKILLAYIVFGVIYMCFFITQLSFMSFNTIVNFEQTLRDVTTRGFEIYSQKQYLLLVLTVLSEAFNMILRGFLIYITFKLITGILNYLRSVAKELSAMRQS